MTASTAMLRRIRGFTLIEILVVLLIIGITLSFALLAVGDFGKARRIATAGEEFLKLIELAEEQAILEPGVFGIKFNSDGYDFYRFGIDKDHPNGIWQSLQSDSVFRSHSFPAGTVYNITINQPQQKFNESSKGPQIIILSSGEITPFTLELMPEGATAAIVRITATEDGTITMQNQLK